MAYEQYHIQHFAPTDPWPKGGWSIYCITGDEIAQRIVCDGKGKVVERHSWCGYIGIAENLDGVAAMIAADKEKNPCTS